MHIWACHFNCKCEPILFPTLVANLFLPFPKIWQGWHVWTVHATSATRRPCRQGHQIIHRRFNQFAATAAEGSLQRHPHQRTLCMPRPFKPFTKCSRSSTKHPSTSLPPPSEQPLFSQPPTGDGSTSSPKPSTTPGTSKIPAARKQWATWAPKNSSACNSKNTSSPSSRP